jgi:hypothetical protein
MENNNYMYVLPFNETRQRKLYRKCSKKKLIDFLIERDFIEYGKKKTKESTETGRLIRDFVKSTLNLQSFTYSNASKYKKLNSYQKF